MGQTQTVTAIPMPDSEAAAAVVDGQNPANRSSLTRRQALAACAFPALGLAFTTLFPGCTRSTGPAEEPDLMWGRRGLSEGRFLKPRAIAIDPDDQLYIVDTTGRIQVFDADGNYLRGWSTPETKFGRPTGLAVDQEGQLLVADTHYNRVLIYSLAGQLHEERTIGGQPGTTPGMFAFVTDVTRDSRGNYYVGDYGDADRVQQFSPERQFIAQWGGTGSGLEELIRPQSLIIDRQDQLWVADACNHRIKAFDTKQSPPKQIACWGTQGSEPGEINYPYGIAFDAEENLWVCEYGNQRIQQFTKDGRSLRIWGSPGKLPGQLYQPWGLVCDRRNRMHILDSNNHRVQRIQL